jgi:hypothetical protein
MEFSPRPNIIRWKSLPFLSSNGAYSIAHCVQRYRLHKLPVHFVFGDRTELLPNKLVHRSLRLGWTKFSRIDQTTAFRLYDQSFARELDV